MASTLATNKNFPIEEISEVFRNYSANDIAETLFISSMWLPNIASPIKHLLLTSIFATINPINLTGRNSISSYSDFKAFHEKIFSLIPSFPTLEDYIPEPDWGDIKFYLNGNNYKIFYGSELENPYGYLELFELFYGSIRENIIKIVRRDPLMDLENVLKMQEEIINGLKCQPDAEDIQKRINPGNLELPSQEFWENAINFLREFKLEERYGKEFLDKYSIQLGKVSKEVLKSKQFGNLAFSGKLLNAFFLRNGSQYYPIIPRRYSTVLFNIWEKAFFENNDKIIEDFTAYTKKIGIRLHRYIESRVFCSSLFPFVSAVNEKGIPDDTFFSSAFISKNKLVLMYIMQPLSPSSKLEDEVSKIENRLHKAKTLISSPPVTIALHAEGKNSEFKSRKDGVTLKPLIILVVPVLSPSLGYFKIPKSFPGKIVFLDQFLGIIDELENADLLSSFYEYLDKIESRMMFIAYSSLDKFVSFKLSHGVLIEGAIKPHLLMIGPHMGSNERFKSLSNFWSLYPETNFFGHPRTWRVRRETSTRIRLEAKSKFETAISSLLGKTRLYITAPISELDKKQIEISNFLMECLEDSFQNRKALIEKHRFFEVYEKLVIIFFSDSMVKEKEIFRHLKHLDASKVKWVSDCGFPEKGVPGVRIVYNDEKVFEAFKDTKDSSEEVELIHEVLSKLNQILPDQNFNEIKDNILKTKYAKPRFKLFERERKVSFPEFVFFNEPQTTHYKLARKRIAELAKQMNLKPGYYEVEEAKEKINELRRKIVNEIDSIVNKYNFKTTIPLLLTQIDSLIHKYEKSRLKIEFSQEHQVDFVRQKQLAEEQEKYVSLHRDYRYLIEKFVQISPQGKDFLEWNQLQYLIAIIDWLHVLYQTSDSLHYGIFPVGVNISNEYLVEVIYDEDIEEKGKLFGREQAELNLGLIGNPNDRVESPRPIENFLNDLDLAFKQDLKFGFRNMINVLQVLSLWADYSKDIEVNTFYSAEFNKIKEICERNIIGFDVSDLGPILDFLTLKSEDVVRVLGKDDPCDDLPIWEHKKRYSRYTLRPLILIGDKYFWGPYSAMKTGVSWTWQLTQTLLPFDLQGNNIQEVINAEKRLIEKALEIKSYDIVKRYTKFARHNIELHRLDKKGNHPQELGEFDVLSYHPDKNVILNIECKDISQVFCLKDAQRLRRTIFGEPKTNSGYLFKVNRRQKYLMNQHKEISEILGWPVDKKNPPKIIAIFLTRRSYWWTRFPPQKVEVVFIRIDLLSTFIENL